MGVLANIKVEPSDGLWGNQNTTEVTTVADVADSLDGLFFNIDAQSGTLYYVWMDGVAAADPAPSGRTGISVAYSTGDSAATLAGLAVTAIAAIADFNAKIDPDDNTKLRIQDINIGAVTAAVDVDSTFAISTLRVGSSLDLGFIDGAIEVSFSEDILDVLAAQEGTNIIEGIRTGKNIDNIAMPMKESQAAKLKTLIEVSGASTTPSGGTEVSGWGSSQDFTSISGGARKLVLHPLRIASGTFTSDLAFWRAYPIITGINFQGDSEEIINVDFKILPDTLIVKAQRLFTFGDHSQDFLR